MFYVNNEACMGRCPQNGEWHFAPTAFTTTTPGVLKMGRKKTKIFLKNEKRPANQPVSE